MDNWQEKYEAADREFKRFKKDYEEFIHLAAHDLDSPLRKLLTFADRFETKFKDLQDESAQLYLDRIKDAAGQMRAVVDSLYHLSLAIAEKPVFQNCDLNKIVARTIRNLQEEIREKNAVFETEGLPTIWGNENQLLILFKNIFDNALKFSGTNVPPTVTVSSAVLKEDEKSFHGLLSQARYHKISVADSGIGFLQEQAEDIFKPFVRLHGKSEFPGSGLGLSICKKIVEHHRGVIYAEGTENSGACFVLILPQKP